MAPIGADPERLTDPLRPGNMSGSVKRQTPNEVVVPRTAAVVRKHVVRGRSLGQEGDRLGRQRDHRRAHPTQGARVWNFLYERYPDRPGVHRHGYEVDEGEAERLAENFRSLGLLAWVDHPATAE